MDPMTLTPSAKGSIIGGFALSALVWSILLHVDKVPLLKNFISRRKIVESVSRNRGLTTLGSEVLNLGVHGVTNPLSVLFATGSTVVNVFFIWMVCPFLAKKTEVNRRVA